MSIDCVLCDESSPTPEDHEQHMMDVHDFEMAFGELPSENEGGERHMNCPFCESEATAIEEPRELELGYVADVECENGHKGTVGFPKSLNAPEEHPGLSDNDGVTE